MVTTKRPRTTKSTRKAKTDAPEVAKVTTNTVNIQDAVRIRAYELFKERGYRHGYDFDDWLRAENEVMVQFGARIA